MVVGKGNTPLSSLFVRKGCLTRRGCQQRFMPMKNTNDGPNGDDGAVMPAGSIVGEYMEPPELSRDLGISKRTLDRWHRQRIGPPRTVIGRTILYRRTAVQEWLRSREERKVSR
jgi:predicted DNA-binding transcriptional regulator AlpA